MRAWRPTATSTASNSAWRPLRPSVARRVSPASRTEPRGVSRASVHLLPSAHTVFGNLKTWLRGTLHGVSPKHLQRYLDEFAFRFDRRWRETELFIRVLHRALDAAPYPYRQLTAERIG